MTDKKNTKINLSDENRNSVIAQNLDFQERISELENKYRILKNIEQNALVFADNNIGTVWNIARHLCHKVSETAYEFESQDVKIEYSSWNFNLTITFEKKVILEVLDHYHIKSVKEAGLKKFIVYYSPFAELFEKIDRISVLEKQIAELEDRFQ